MNAPAQVKLGDCVRLAKGKPPAQQPYYGADSAWYLSPEYLRGAAACERAKPRANAVHVQDGNTILLWDGSNAGEVFLAREGMLASTMTLVSPDNRFTSDYFFFALKQWEPYLKGQTSGSGIPHVDKEVLGKLEITEFAKPEQSKIAEVLSTVDRAIAQTEALIAKQQRIKTGLMQDLLTRGIDEHGQLRSEATHAFKDSSLGRIPAEWDVATIQSLLADVDPAMRSGPFGSALLKEELVDSGIPLLGIDNVLPEFLVKDYRRFVSTEKAKQLRRYQVRAGDIMITIMGTVGRCCVVPDDIGTALSSKHVWTITLDRSKYSAYLACLQINHSPWVLSHFADDVQGGIMSSIRSNTLRSVLFPVPPFDEMKKIEGMLRAIADSIQSDKEALAKVRPLKAALMQDLLTGKVRVTPLLKQVEAANA